MDIHSYCLILILLDAVIICVCIFVFGGTANMKSNSSSSSNSNNNNNRAHMNVKINHNNNNTNHRCSRKSISLLIMSILCVWISSQTIHRSVYMLSIPSDEEEGGDEEKENDNNNNNNRNINEEDDEDMFATSSRDFVPMTTLTTKRSMPNIDLKEEQEMHESSHDNTAPNNSHTYTPRIVMIDSKLKKVQLPPMKSEEEQRLQKRRKIIPMSATTTTTVAQDVEDNFVLYQKLDNPKQEVNYFETQCEPILSSSKSAFHPTCNTLHEIDNTLPTISLLSMRGSWRSVWNIQQQSSLSLEHGHGHKHGHEHEHESSSSSSSSSHPTNIILKLLQWNRNYTSDAYKQHEIDIITMDRLTGSPHIVKAYGFCGQSVMTEYGESSKIIIKDKHFNIQSRLKLARDMARGLADLHALQPIHFDNDIDNEDYTITNNNHDHKTIINNYHLPPPTPIVFAHQDINIANTVSVVVHGRNITDQHVRVQWNDFNLGILLRRRKRGKDSTTTASIRKINTTTNKNKNLSDKKNETYDIDNDYCPVPVRFYSPLWRSPEEIEDNGLGFHAEASDVYSLGNLLFQILTTRQPWTHLEVTQPTLEEVAEQKLAGSLPRIPESFWKRKESKGMEAMAIWEATMACYRLNPSKRPTAYELARALETAYQWSKDKKKLVDIDRAIQSLFEK